MIEIETLRKIVDKQKEELKKRDLGIKREILKNISLKGTHIIILSGMRRSGKSTLLKQIIKEYKNYYFFNFEDQQAYGFDIFDFNKLDEIFNEKFKSENYCVDEIQNVEGWERFIRTLHDNEKKIIVTGSNASLLSKELGTKLTGRHIRYEVFPFSYNEMIKLFNKKPNKETFEEYMSLGGFPEFLKDQRQELLQELFNDTITRDIVIRYGLKDQKVITNMATYLITNMGKEFSYNKIKEQFKLGSVNTVISYISYLEDCYLLFTIPKFEFSYKKQLISPKKIYSIDTGVGKAISASYSKDLGRILENIVFLHLRRKYKEIFYHKEKFECDFIIKDKDKIIKAIQVCYDLTNDNLNREIEGLREAIKRYKLKKGFIITFDQKDYFGDDIEVVPAWKFLSENLV